MRRGGTLAARPAPTGYPWEALQGATVTTELLARNGYPNAWSWGDSALVRAIDFLRRLDAAYGGWWANGDDRWNVWLVNYGSGSIIPICVPFTPVRRSGLDSCVLLSEIWSRVSERDG